MAGPSSIFNNGASGVSVNSAVAAPFLRNIASIVQNNRKNSLFNKQLENTKDFREAQLEDADERLLLSREAQEFTQGAEARQKEKNIAQGQLLSGATEGLSYEGAARLDDAGIQKILSADPIYAGLSDETGASRVAKIQASGRTLSPQEIEKIHLDSAKDQTTKFGYQNQFVLNNPGAGGDPQQYTQRLTAALMQTGDFTPEQAAIHAANKTASLFPSTSEKMQVALINAFKPTAAQLKVVNNNSGGGTTSTKTGADSFRNQFDIESLQGASGLAAKIADERKLPFNRSNLKQVGEFLGAGAVTDPGRLDPSQTQITEVIGRLATAGIVSSSAMEQAINKAFDPDDGNTIKDKFNFRTAAGFDALYADALKIQNAEITQVNSKTGSNQTRAQAAGNADATAASLAQQIYQEQVNSIRSGGVPKRQTDAQLAQQFLSGLGSTPNAPLLTPPVPGKTQGGNTTTGASEVDGTGEVAEQQSGGTGIPDLDELLNSDGDLNNLKDEDSVTGSSTLDSLLETPEAEFSVGQPSQGEKVEQTIKDTLLSTGKTIAENSPPALFANAAKTGIENAKKIPDLAASLVDSLSIRDSEINSINQGRAPSDLRGLNSKQRTATLTKAKALLKQGKISYDDGPEGGTLNDKLIIAYRKYIATN